MFLRRNARRKSVNPFARSDRSQSQQGRLRASARFNPLRVEIEIYGKNNSINIGGALFKHPTVRIKRTAKHPCKSIEHQIARTFPHITPHHFSPLVANRFALAGWVRRRYTSENDGYLAQASIIPIQSVDTLADLQSEEARLQCTRISDQHCR